MIDTLEYLKKAAGVTDEEAAAIVERVDLNHPDLSEEETAVDRRGMY